MKAQAALLPLVRKYLESDPASAAHHLETMEEEQAADVLSHIPPALAFNLVQHLSEVFTAQVLPRLPRDLFLQLADRLDAHRGMNIAVNLPPEERALFLENLSEKKKRQIQELLSYPEDSAGRIMKTNFLALHSDLAVKDAVHKIRQLARKGSSASYVYVIDDEGRLVGVLNMRDMMLAKPAARLEEIMRPQVFTVDSFMDREKVAQELSNQKFFAAPVVDRENHLLGTVQAEALLEGVEEEATEDIQKMFGAGADERAFSPVRFSLRQRLPWLYVNLATAFLAAAVVALFENVIARITVLAVFLPVIAGQGGNAGAQSLAVVMRGLVMREIPPRKVRQLLFKETSIGVINGLSIGLVTALIAWLWHGNFYFGVVIGLGMLANLIVAGLAGAAIPLTMKSIGLDPAQCSNIILTTVTDVMGFFAFLSLAVLFINHLT